MASLLIGTGQGQGPDGRSGVRGVAPGAKVISYTIRSVSETSDCLNAAGVGAPGDAAFRDAVADGADIINVSGTLLLSDTAYVEALQAGVIVVAAAGNEGGPLAGAPATMNGAVAVGTVTVDRELDPGSPVGPELGVVAPGAGIRCTDETYTTYFLCTGSSDAAAYTSGVLALAWSLHPDATANQILQAMVHTTDGEVRETPVRDDAWGYGTVNARLLMDADPTSYPDVNPFVRDDPQADPPASTLVQAMPAEESESSRPDRADDVNADEDTGPGPGASAATLVVGVTAALLTVATSVLMVLRRRRARANTPPGA